MLRIRSALLCVVLAAAVVTAPGVAADERPGAPAPSLSHLTGLTDVSGVLEQTGFSSDNVEWLGIMPQHTGTAGGQKLGKHYYLTDPRGVYIYDVSDPADPELTGELRAFQMGTHAVLAQEEPETNGKILLVNAVHPDGGSPGPAAANGWLLVVDVSDKSSPQVVGSLDVYDHTWSCVLKCKYAIGRTGHIVDLRDPTEPEIVADWRQHVFMPGYMHDFIEVAPGRVIGSGQPSFYLDLRNPLKPRQLARWDPEFHSLGYHGAAWPNNGKDPLLVMGAEVAPQGSNNTAGSDCNHESVYAVATYDARAVVKVDRKEFGKGKKPNKIALQRERDRAAFKKLKEWRVAGRGAYADGNAPAHTLYCGHWFDPHPKWKAGGILAMAHYEWGTRFLNVRKNGNMEEVGYFQPVPGYTGSVKWINNEIAYVHDYRRGLEILRFTD